MGLKFTRKLDYALYLLDILKKEPKKPVSINSVSKEHGLPRAFMEKVALELKKGGLIRALKGREGGYVLTKKPEKINLGEVVGIFEKEENCGSCFYAQTCPAKKIKSEVDLEIKKIFEKRKL